MINTQKKIVWPYLPLDLIANDLNDDGIDHMYIPQKKKKITFLKL